MKRWPPEIAYWERGEWWLAGNARPWQPDGVNVLGDKLVFKPRLTPVAGLDPWYPRRVRRTTVIPTMKATMRRPS
jgi:hypothetical protein